MVKKCCVNKCKSNVQRKCYNEVKLSFFRFPSKVDERNKWRNAFLCLNNQVLPQNISKFAVVCSKHFEDDQFIKKGTVCFLRKGSIPKIFPNLNPDEYLDIEYLEMSFHESSVQTVNVTDVEMNDEGLVPTNESIEIDFKDNIKYDNELHYYKKSTCYHCGQSNFIMESNSNLTIAHSIDDDGVCTSCTEEICKQNLPKDKVDVSGVKSNEAHVVDENPMKNHTMREEDEELKENVSPNARKTPISKTKRRIYYPGDVPENSDLSPKSSKKYISTLRRTIAQQRLHSKILLQQNRRKTKKIASLESLLKDLKDKGIISDNAQQMLKTGVTNEVSFMDKIRRGKVQNMYPPDVRTFALTLNFYSPQAYRYVRKTYANKLPAPRTIRKWYETINGSPGLTKEALTALSNKKKDLAEKGIQLKTCLSFDGMSIRKQVEFDGHKKKYFGYVDFGGINIDKEENAVATEAWFLLVTSLNDYFKVPIGYFLVNGLTSKEKAAIINNALETLHEYDIEVNALVYDGDPGNVAMVNELNTTMLNPTYFLHPSTNQKVHIIVDICHMIKLVRNTLANKKVLIDGNNGLIEWKYLQMLHDLQEDMQTRLGNKLSRKHILFQNQKMKVKYATQTLSRSVANSLKTLKDIDPRFKSCGPLIEFIEIFDCLFDICNSKSKFGKFYKRPLGPETELQFFSHFDKSIKYINELKLLDKQLIVQSRNRTGFKGFLQSMCSIRNIYTEQCKNGPLKYLLTYKLSQDHLETFFGVIRSRGGFNNNPNTMQLMSAYKQVLIHNEIESPATANCIPLDKTNILTVSSSKILCIESEENDPSSLSKEYGKVCPNFDSMPLSEAIIYIAGFVQRAITRKISCQDCVAALNSREKITGILLRNKNYGQHGGLCNPTQDVVVLCRIAERNLKSTNNLHEAKMYSFLLNKCMREVPPKLLDNMEEHVKDCDPLENHRYLLIRCVLEEYLKVKLFHIGKLETLKMSKSFVRAKNTKLILFSGQ